MCAYLYHLKGLYIYVPFYLICVPINLRVCIIRRETFNGGGTGEGGNLVNRVKYSVDEGKLAWHAPVVSVSAQLYSA